MYKKKSSSNCTYQKLTKDLLVERKTIQSHTVPKKSKGSFYGLVKFYILGEMKSNQKEKKFQTISSMCLGFQSEKMFKNRPLSVRTNVKNCQCKNRALLFIKMN